MATSSVKPQDLDKQLDSIMKETDEEQGSCSRLIWDKIRSLRSSTPLPKSLPGTASTSFFSSLDSQVWQLFKSYIQEPSKPYVNFAYWHLIGYGPGAYLPSKPSWPSEDLEKVYVEGTLPILTRGYYHFNKKKIDLSPFLEDGDKKGKKIERSGQLIKIVKTLIGENAKTQNTEFFVVNFDPIEMTLKCKKAQMNPVLIFPAYWEKTGGYLKGNKDLEADLCRRTALSFLTTDNPLKGTSTRLYPIIDSEVLYSKEVPVFRSTRENHYAFLPQLDTISLMAFPKINNTAEEYWEHMQKRIYNQLNAAHVENHDCLVIAPFGYETTLSGAEAIAKTYQNTINLHFKNVFKKIIFVFATDPKATPDQKKIENYQIFRNVFQQKPQPSLEEKKDE